MKALAGIVSAAFAGLLLVLGRRRVAHVALGSFLALIAANQFVETLRALAPDSESASRLLRLAGVFAAADPFALFYFASLFPARNRLNETRWLLAVGAPGALLVAACAVLPPDLAGPPAARSLAFALSAYTAVVYLLVLRHALRSGPAGGAFLAAAMVIALPAFGRMGETAYSLAGLPVPGVAAEAANAGLRVAMILLALGLALLDARRAGVPARALAMPLVWGAAVAGFVVLPQVLVAVHPPLLQQPWLLALGRGGNSVRWLAFGALISVAIVRDGLLDFGPASRRLAARVVIGLAFFAATALVIDALGGFSGSGGFRLGWAETALLLVAIALSQGFRDLVDRVAGLLYGLPPAPTAIGQDEPLRAGGVLAKRYAVERVLATGGSARVFLARDEVAGGPVALKEILVDPRVSSRVAAQEARVAGLLAHPHVVAVRDVVERSGSCILVCEYVEGGTLADLVEAEGPLDAARGAPLLAQVLDGLAHVHARGVVHRDVKPSNVLLSDAGLAKLTDFGVARLVREDTTRVPGAVGTPAFMAPEQARGEPATPATDVYAVGLLARRCLAEPLPPALEAVVERALEHDPAARFPDAGAMLAAWRQAGGLQ